MDAELAGEPERRQAVGQPVGHGLDPAAQLRVDLVHRDAERLGCDERVQVLTGGERPDQPLVTGEVRHDAHLYLGVVGREQGLVPRADDERPADLAALGGAHRDVLQVGVGRGQPAGRRDHLVERRVDPAGVVDHRDERIHHRAQPGDVPVAQEHGQQRMVGLGGKPGQRVRVGGVAGLDFLGLRQAQLVEEDHLQLLGRAEVERPADDLLGLRGHLGHLRAVVLLEVEQMVGVGRDPGPFHPGEHRDQRELDVAQQRGGTAAGQVGVEGVGELQRRAGPHDVGGGRGRLVRPVDGQLPCLGRLRAQVASQVAQDEVGEVEGALAGQGQVGGERGVAGDAGEGEAAGGEREDRPLDVVDGLGPAVVGQPGGQRRVVVRGERDGVDPGTGAGTVGGGERETGHAAGAPAPAAPDVHAEALPVAGVRGQPAGHLPWCERLRGHLKARVGLGLDCAQRRVQPLPQHPELQGVEELVDGLPVPRPELEVGGGDRQRHVTGQLGQRAVTDHVGQVCAQRRARLPADLVGPVHQRGQRPELLNPLGGGLLPHPGHRRQVVRRVPAQRGEVRVLRRGEAVLRLDLGGGEPGHVADATPGHQDRHPLVDELQRVPVAGDDEDLHAQGRALGGERGDDVVGLVPGGGDPGDGQGVAHLVDEADLPDEVRGRLGSSRLVLGVLGVPEGRRRQVPGHRDVGGPLVPQHVDQH